jgi:hypothetical protein
MPRKVSFIHIIPDTDLSLLRWFLLERVSRSNVRNPKPYLNPAKVIGGIPSARPTFIKMKELAQSNVTSRAIRTAETRAFSREIFLFFIET